VALFQYSLVFSFPSGVDDAEKLDGVSSHILKRLFTAGRDIEGRAGFHGRHLLINHEPSIPGEEIIDFG
jgi:hypothetical protein